ncbi:MAG TPA: hypothetical protein VI911_02395 [Patescibacteria group bacterium]|nr:hypothetical protein [Patescibacteria group bacterium]
MVKEEDVAVTLDKAFSLFNVAVPFTLSELKKNYRELCRDNHPDRFIAGPGREAAETVMAEINGSLKMLAQCASDDRTEDEMLLLDRETLVARLSKDPYAVYETCRKCLGDKIISNTHIIRHEDCPSCEGAGLKEHLCKDCYGTGVFLAGVKELSCSACNGTGSFTMKNGKSTSCLKCDGTGVFQVKLKNQYKCRTCEGTGKIVHSCSKCNATGIIAITGVKKTVCSSCLGVGEVKMDLWNPVIPAGAILCMSIQKQKKNEKTSSVSK